MESVFINFLLLIALVLYFIPTIIASKRNHKNFSAILVLNLLLGWTFLGWVGSIVWALTKE
ncbi:MAG: superinfection immunity protein [Firmicutes bacterium]|nr:superinfection immunity protein [Bacillota bacterium]